VVAGPAFGVEPAGAGGAHAPTLGLLAPELVAALEVTDALGLASVDGVTVRYEVVETTALGDAMA